MHGGERQPQEAEPYHLFNSINTYWSTTEAKKCECQIESTRGLSRKKQLPKGQVFAYPLHVLSMTVLEVFQQRILPKIKINTGKMTILDWLIVRLLTTHVGIQNFISTGNPRVRSAKRNLQSPTPTLSSKFPFSPDI